MQLFECFYQIVMNDDVAVAVIACGISVDYRQRITSEISDETCGRIDDKRGTADYQKIGA